MYAIAKGAPGQTGLANAGPQMPVVLSGPSGHGIYTAEIDEGSSISSVDLAVLRRLGCQQSGTADVGTVMGSGQEPIYTCGMAALDGVDLAAGLPGVLGDSLPAGGPRVLIGRDILQRFDFQYDGPGGTWQLGAPGAAPQQGPNPWRVWWPWATAGAVGTVLGVGILAAGRGVERAVVARRGSVSRSGGYF